MYNKLTYIFQYINSTEFSPVPFLDVSFECLSENNILNPDGGIYSFNPCNDKIEIPVNGKVSVLNTYLNDKHQMSLAMLDNSASGLYTSFLMGNFKNPVTISLLKDDIDKVYSLLQKST